MQSNTQTALVLPQLLDNSETRPYEKPVKMQLKGGFASKCFKQCLTIKNKNLFSQE